MFIKILTSEPTFFRIIINSRIWVEDWLKVRKREPHTAQGDATMEDMIRLQCEICKTFSNPSRMQVIKLLHKRDMLAAELMAETAMSKANLSQHMTILVKNGIVDCRKQGKAVSYSLSHSKIGEVCMIMQEVTVEIIKRKYRMVENIQERRETL
jgi:DNA-binding transcriptional ArsR family regulator